MTLKEREEGNALIAEFMGLVALKKPYLGAFTTNGSNEIEPSFSVFINDKMVDECWYVYPEFHSSWDWLMPVVEKIHSDTDFLVTIYYRSCKVFPMNRGVEMDILIKEKPTIEAVWTAVVEFIKWHNKN